MAESDVDVELQLAAGEDAAWQIFWTDEYGEPTPISDPVLMDVKDANGQIALRFSTTNDPSAQAYASVGGPNGFIQLTVPSELTRQLIPGAYRFDLFASVADSAPPFDRQLKQILDGWMVVGSRVTKIEDAAEAILSSTPGG